MDDLASINKKMQKIYFKMIIEILSGDFPEPVLRERLRGYMNEYEHLANLLSLRMGGNRKEVNITDEKIDRFVQKVRDEYDIFYINGRIKIARKGTKLYHLYLSKQLYETPEATILYSKKKGDDDGTVYR